MLRRYRPIQRLGGGGFGKTYLAEDVEKFNAQCVIKQFAPQVQGSGALQVATRLFEDEAKRLQQLGEHPQIPTLLAYFEEAQRLYLVQQYIEGRNLWNELEAEGAFGEKKIREVLVDSLNILKSVHQHNVIHRDIKPENIIRRRFDGKLVLIDFGASKQLTATVINRPGTSIGSFGYAPIEQMEDREVYPASDLYSLGVTCFHLLTGIDPWELWKKQGYGWIGNWRQQLKEPVSQEFEHILDKLLQEDYQQRYQSVEEVLEDLSIQPSLPPSVSSEILGLRDSASPKSSPLPEIVSRSQLPLSEPPAPLEIVPLPESLPIRSSVPPQISPQPQSSLPPIASPKQKSKVKMPFLVGGAILFLGLGGYGISHITTTRPLVNTASTYQKLALSTTLTGHSSAIDSVAISSDGQTLISGSSDSTIKIWDLKTGQQRTTLTDQTYPVNNFVAINPDGQTLISGSLDLKIWDLKSGALKTSLTGHSNWVNSIVISSDGQSLISGSSDGTIKIWDLKTSSLKTTLNEPSGAVSTVAVSADGQTIASGSGTLLTPNSDNTIKIWDVKTGSVKTTLSGHSEQVNSIAISPDGQTLVSGSRDNTIKIWDLKTGSLKTTLTGHGASVSSVAISPDGQMLVTGSEDNTVKVWNLKKAELETSLTGHNSAVSSVAISPDGQTVVSGSDDNTIRIWRVPK
jgi:WD40 repeat protein